MRRWLGFISAISLLLGLFWLNLNWLESPVDISPLMPQPSSAPRKEGLKASPFASATDLGESAAESLARPLFHSSRRPFKAAPAASEEPPPVEEVAVSVEEPPAVAKPSLRLVGVSVSNGQRRILLGLGDEGTALQWYGVGDSVQGWTVAAISGKAVRLESGVERFTVTLYPSREAEPGSSNVVEPQ